MVNLNLAEYGTFDCVSVCVSSRPQCNRADAEERERAISLTITSQPDSHTLDPPPTNEYMFKPCHVTQPVQSHFRYYYCTGPKKLNLLFIGFFVYFQFFLNEKNVNNLY